MDEKIKIYTDGACSGNPGKAGIGVVLICGKHKKEISKFIGDSTNNIAELEAIRQGLLAVKNKKTPIKIFTDSAYCIGALTSSSWNIKKNIGLINLIKTLMSKFNDLKFIKIDGHSGNEYNEMANALAASAIVANKNKKLGLLTTNGRVPIL